MKFSATVALIAVQAVSVVSSPVHADEPVPRSADINVLTKRACWTSPQKYGCSKGFCWEVCDAGRGSGEWCWLADGKDGKGAWTTCSSDDECLNKIGHSQAACGVGNCDACGCSCNHT